MENTNMETTATTGAVMQDKVSEFLINRDIEETNLTIDCAKALLGLDLEVKAIKEDQKEIKKEAKANGVSVQKVTKVLGIMKAALKTNDADLSEIEMIEAAFNNDVDIRTMVSEMVAQR